MKIKTRSEDHKVKLASGLFAQCDGCKMWVRVPKDGFIPLLSDPIRKHNWLCHECWDEVDEDDYNSGVKTDHERIENGEKLIGYSSDLYDTIITMEKSQNNYDKLRSRGGL